MYLCVILLDGHKQSVLHYEINENRVGFLKNGSSWRAAIEKHVTRTWRHKRGVSAIAQNKLIAEMLAKEQIKRKVPCDEW